jgi:hypothetical protein
MIIKILGNVIHDGRELEIGSEMSINNEAGQSLIDCGMAELISNVKPVEDDMPVPMEVVEEVKKEIKPVVKRKRRVKK